MQSAIRRTCYTRYWDDLGAAGNFDLIVNATSAGLGAAKLTLPFGLVARRTLCYDLSYGAAAFAFLAWARAAGAGPALDGLGNVGRAGGRIVRDLAWRAAGHGTGLRRTARRTAAARDGLAA
jgi:hypothetical protein